VLQSWADGEWFTSRPEVPTSQKLTVFKVTGETNTDDLSPAPDAWSRPDIPLHALAMLKNPRPGIEADVAGVRGPVKFSSKRCAAKGNLIAYVGDVVGTGSSRKSATNSVLWFTGEDIPFVPNKRFGGVCLGSKIAPIFFNTMEDAGALPIELDVEPDGHGRRDRTQDRYRDGQGHRAQERRRDRRVATQDPVILDEVRAGGRIPLIIGRGLTTRAREALGLPVSTLFRLPQAPADTGKGYTLAQKMVGRACGMPEGKGVLPGTYCEPRMTTVGSQDTTGPMTRDELKDLACLGFSADLVMQSFCHTAAYPKLVDVKMHRELPSFHQHPRRRLAASGRRRHPLLAQPPAAARHRRHRRRLAHPLPDRHLVPGRLRPGRLRRGHRRDAARHAGIGAGALQGQDAAGRHPA
jgi:aconitate hydratase 2/2-methylisocitrate dehydratase